MGLWKDAFDKSLAAVSVKSESLVESSRVRTAIANTQKSVDAAVTALGVKYYNSWLAGSIDQAEIEADCEKIKQLNDECANLKARLEQIKVEERQILGQQKRPPVAPSAAVSGEYIFCTNCGKRLESSARFCDECGTQVKP